LARLETPKKISGAKWWRGVWGSSLYFCGGRGCDVAVAKRGQNNGSECVGGDVALDSSDGDANLRRSKMVSSISDSQGRKEGRQDT
jgi:hypothetical protein